MKTFNLAVIAAAVALVTSSITYAQDSHNNINVQNISKRPYAHTLPKEAYQKAEQFEGATLIRSEAEEQEASAQEQKNRVHRSNNFSRRPY